MPLPSILGPVPIHLFKRRSNIPLSPQIKNRTNPIVTQGLTWDGTSWAEPVPVIWVLSVVIRSLVWNSLLSMGRGSIHVNSLFLLAVAVWLMVVLAISWSQMEHWKVVLARVPLARDTTPCSHHHHHHRKERKKKG